MKRNGLYFVSVLVCAAMSFVSCEETEGITSAFEISVGFPTGNIVNGSEAVFTVNSTREWYLSGQECSVQGDIDFSTAVPKISRDGDAFPEGLTTFTVPAEGVNVSETHRGVLTLYVTDKVTGTKRTITTRYDAYVGFHFDISDFEPVVYNGMDYTFTVSCPVADRFTLEKLECPKGLEPAARQVLRDGAEYELADHRRTFSFPVKVAENIIDEDFALNIIDEAGQKTRLAVKMNAVEFSYPKEAVSVAQGSSAYEWRPMEKEAMSVRCRGGFVISCAADSEGAVVFAQSDKRNAADGYTETLRVEDRSGAEEMIYLRGTKPGLAKVIIQPAVMEPFGFGAVTAYAWVRPKAVLYVDGDFANVRNGVNYMTDNGGYTVYADDFSGGWSCLPDRLGYSFREVGADALPNSGVEYADLHFGSFEDMNAFSYGESPLRWMTLMSENHRQAPKLSSLPASAGRFEANIVDRYDTLRTGVFSLKVVTEASLLNGGAALSDKVWWDGSGVAFPADGGLDAEADCGRVQRQVRIDEIGGREFSYTRQPLRGYDDRLVFERRNWSHAGLPLWNATADGNVSYRKGTHLSAGPVLGGDIWPWHRDVLLSGNTDGLCYMFNRYADNVALSGSRESSMLIPDKGDAAAEHLFPTGTNGLYRSFGFRISEFSYDKSLMDVVGVVYGFKIYDDTDSRFNCGMDYWWGTVDPESWWRDIKTVVVKDINEQ